LSMANEQLRSVSRRLEATQASGRQLEAALVAMRDSSSTAEEATRLALEDVSAQLLVVKDELMVTLLENAARRSL